MFSYYFFQDDFAERILDKKLKIIRYPSTIGKYSMLLHEKEKPSKERYKLLEEARERSGTDGLNSLKYVVLDKKYFNLYTWILVKFEKN